jgi:hypothetical protein
LPQSQQVARRRDAKRDSARKPLKVEDPDAKSICGEAARPFQCTSGRSL